MDCILDRPVRASGSCPGKCTDDHKLKRCNIRERGDANSGMMNPLQGVGFMDAWVQTAENGVLPAKSIVPGARGKRRDGRTALGLVFGGGWGLISLPSSVCAASANELVAPVSSLTLLLIGIVGVAGIIAAWLLYNLLQMRSRKAEGVLYSLCHSSRDVLLRVDIPGNSIECLTPRSLHDLLGYSREEFETLQRSEKGDEVLFHPEERKALVEGMKIKMEAWKAGAERTPYHAIYQVRHADGHWVWMENLCWPHFEGSGALSEVFSTLRDVTDKHEEDQRRQSMLDGLQAGICLLDSKGHIVKVNSAFTRLARRTGTSEDVSAITGMDYLEVHDRYCPLDPGTRKNIAMGIARVLSGEYERFEEEFSCTIEGETRWFLLGVNSLRVNAQVAGCVAAHYDITPIKLAEEHAQASESRLRTILDMLPVGVIIADREGNWTYSNKAAKEIQRWSDAPGGADAAAAIYYHADGSPLDPEDHPLTRAALRGETVVNCAVYRKAPTGNARQHQMISATPIHDRASGEPVGAVATVADETMRHQLEARLLHAQRLETVGRLAGGIAHDFNNILTVIFGYVVLLLDQLPDSNPMREDVEEIRQAAEHASHLTRQLLSFSRRQAIETIPVNLNEILTNMQKMLNRLLGENLQITLQTDERLGIIRADPGQIEQVIVNLSVNARDSMPKGGELHFETVNVDLDADFARRNPGISPGPYVGLIVRDTGLGMTEEVKQHIFEPFFTTKESGKGTGLGLATVYGIIIQHRGYIAVDSEPGQGSCFRIYFPRVAEEILKPARFTPAAALRGRETILLVEDEEVVRNLARRILNRYGYKVLETANPHDALLVSERHQGTIDLVVTDIVLPRMSGQELAEQLQIARPGIKILFTSGYTSQEVTGILPTNKKTPPNANAAAAATSTTYFIQKPFTPEGLARKVRSILDGNTPPPLPSPSAQMNPGDQPPDA